LFICRVQILYSVLKNLSGIDDAFVTAALFDQIPTPVLVGLVGGTCKVYDAARVEDTLELLSNDVKQGVYVSYAVCVLCANERARKWLAAELHKS
jgi:hypothetical protein